MSNMFNHSDSKTQEEYLSGLEEPRKSEIKKLDKLIREAAQGFRTIYNERNACLWTMLKDLSLYYLNSMTYDPGAIN